MSAPHGGDGARVARALGLDPSTILDLSASLNPVAPDLTPLIHGHLGALRTYPDAEEATAAMAGALGVDPARVLLTNGGAEAIALVARDMGGGRVDDPEFSLYRRHLAEVDDRAPRWRSDPHNPTGVLAAKNDARNDAHNDAHNDAVSVWDEAFYPLATGRWTSGRADEGAIVLGSLTKVFACPGLRVGFVLADPDRVQRLANRQPRWSVNGLVCAALPEMLERARLQHWATEVARLRDDLHKVLSHHGLHPSPSDANYVLVPGAKGVRGALAKQGVIVRDCASFGLIDHVRIAVPNDDGLERVAKALEAW